MKYLLPVLFIALTFWSCDDKDATEGNLSLQFQLTYDGEPLAMYDERDYTDDQSIFFDRFNLFLSNGNLMQQNTEAFAFDVLFLDFSGFQDQESATKGLEVLLTDIKEGTYDGLELGIGLAPEWNATTPEDYSSSHPLSNNYWTQWDSYIFTTIEGKADISNDGRFDLPLTYHIGKDENFRPLQFNQPLTIEGGKTTSLRFTIDLKDIFQNAERRLDLEDTPVDHSNDANVYEFLINNLADNMELERL